ncbi:MAG TPA: hypothetical protein VG435_16285 [Acidimicrobiales bacterium]|nr:hypothetical protein [Acidimicrobiales bacterium]
MRRTTGGHLETDDGSIEEAGAPSPDEGTAAEDTFEIIHLDPNRRPTIGARRSKHAQLAADVLARLQSEPGMVFGLSQLAEEFGRPAKDLSNILVRLRKTVPEIDNPVRGCWTYAHGADRPPPARVAGRVRRWGARRKIEEWVMSHPGQIFVPIQIADELEVEVKTVNDALSSLRDYLGPELQKPGRGTWRYEPVEVDDRQQLRLRLGAVQQELERGDDPGVSPVMRRLLIEEQARVLDRLAAVRAPDEDAMTPTSAPTEDPMAPAPRHDLPDDCPARFETVTVHGDDVVVKDDHGELWLAHHIDLSSLD